MKQKLSLIPSDIRVCNDTLTVMQIGLHLVTRKIKAAKEILISTNVKQGFQPNFGIEFHDFSLIFPEIFLFFQGTSTE